MSDVFVSYAREDQPVAQALATALQSMGWSVWWDTRIPAGKEFSRVIEEELASARCVVVLWSKKANSSAYVRDEAGAASSRGVLIPARIEKVQPPLGFRQMQTADLLNWSGDSSHPGFEKIVEAIENLTDTKAAHEPVFERIGKRSSEAIWISGVIVAIVVSVIIAYHMSEEKVDTEMVSLPGAQYIMGSNEQQAKDALQLAGKSKPTWAEDEQPEHDVTLDTFLIDKFEVTVAEYRKYLADAGSQGNEAHIDLRDSRGENHPITGITWAEAWDYCKWAAKSLPSEAQWEYAARSGTNYDYPWGNSPVNDLRANFCGRKCNNASSIEDDEFLETAPVGSFEAGKSIHGIYDLAGNAAEWIRDAYDPRFYEKTMTRNPINEKPHREGHRVVRGGSYADDPYFLRAATRVFRSENTRDAKIGFRCVKFNRPDG